MKKLFGLFLLAAAWLAPTAADAANCFWVGGSATWDGTNTGGGGSGGIKWASTSGGSSACAGGGTGGSPSTGDNATLDGSSGGGTVTVNTTVAVQSISAGAFTGTLDFSANNNNVTVSSAGNAINFSGSGARTINMGSGTWTLSGGGTFENTTQTNCTSCVYSNASINLNGSNAARAFNGGSQTYGAVSVGSNATKGYMSLNGNNTFASLTVADGTTVLLNQGGTNTISGVLTITGTASSPAGLQSSSPSTNAATLSVGSASTIVWGSILRVTKSGAGSITATNSFDLGGNTSITISPPTGGGGGGRIIGG